MSFEAPKAADLFGETSAKKAAAKFEEYTDALNKSFSNPSTTPGQPSAMQQLESLTANKSLTADAVAALGNALTAQRTAMGDIVKDISLTSPLSTSFAAFDLEAPAKLLTPRPTPLRNKIVRKKGVGTSHRIKRITGYTGTGTGGQGVVWPGITETSTATFGASTYNRGPKISYSAEDAIFPYFEYSLSDNVSFAAQFAGQGYQDLRQLSSTSTLYASMLMEERMLLMGRGTASGLSGALAAPTVTLSAVSAGTGQTALANNTYYVYVTSDAGAFGESVVSTVQSQATTSQLIKIVVGAVSGALGYKVYVGTTTGVANAKYCGRITSTTGYLNGAASTLTTGDNITFSTTGALAPTADTSAYATGYDGIIPQIVSGGGVVNNINGAFSTSNPGVEFQTVFSNLYSTVKGDPDEIWLNGADRRQLSDAIKNGSNANYRINLTQSDVGGYTGGAVVDTLVNETTGKQVSLSVHPWLPTGVAPVLSYTLPIPDTEVSDVWAAVNVTDYQGYQWPVVDFNYSFSTYWQGTLVGYAPAWNGIVTGIQSA